MLNISESLSRPFEVLCCFKLLAVWNPLGKINSTLFTASGFSELEQEAIRKMDEIAKNKKIND